MKKEQFKKYFIPNKENDYAPHILKRAALTVMLFLVLVSFAASNIQAIVMVSSNWFISTILPAVIVDVTNENRDGANLGVLKRSPLLDVAATRKAEHMAQYEYFAHNSPDGITPWYWFQNVGYTYSHAGENLAVHFTDSEEVVDAWMNSPGHRANILDGDFTEIGIGTAKGEYKGFPTVFVVQMFGRPGVAQATPPPAQPTPTPTPTPTPDPIALNDDVEEDTGVTVQGTQNDTPDDEPSTTTPENVSPVEELSRELAEASNEDVEETADTSDDQASSTDGVTFSDEFEILPVAPTMVLEEMATTSGLPPVAAISPEDSVPPKTGILHTLSRMLTQPGKVLTIIYSVLAMFVVVTLVTSIAIEWRHQKPVQIAYSGGLLALMAVMWYVHETLVSGVLIA